MSKEPWEKERRREKRRREEEGRTAEKGTCIGVTDTAFLIFKQKEMHWMFHALLNKLCPVCGVTARVWVCVCACVCECELVCSWHACAYIYTSHVKLKRSTTMVTSKASQSRHVARLESHPLLKKQEIKRKSMWHDSKRPLLLLFQINWSDALQGWEM